MKINKYQYGRSIDLSDIQTTNNRPYNKNRAELSYKYLADKNYGDKQASSVVGTLIEESGVDPYAKSKNGTYQGAAQWGVDRYRIPEYTGVPSSKDTLDLLYKQLDLIDETIRNTTDGKSWTHGGKNSGYSSAADANNQFFDDNNTLERINHAFTLGYIRPKGKHESAANRYKVAEQVYDRIKESKNNSFYFGDINRLKWK